MHQRAGLVEVGDVERDAELDRRQRDAALEHRAGSVVGGDRRTPGSVVGLLCQLVDQWQQDVVLDHLLVRRDVARCAGVEIGATYRQRVGAQPARHTVEDQLDRQRALRPAEAAEGGVALGVGLRAIAVYRHRGQPVGVVEMAQRAGHHRRRQVGRMAGVGHHVDRHAQDAADVVEAHVPSEVEAVTPAGDREVVVAVWPQLDRPLQLVRGQRGDAGEQRALALLAAEAAAHAPALHLHQVRGELQRVGHQVLHLARVLGAAVQQQAAVFLRQGVADLALEVELLLPAEREAALQPVRCSLQCGVGIAARQLHRRHHILLRRMGVECGQQRRQELYLQRLAGQRGGPAGGVAGLGDHRKHRLADMAHAALGQDGVVVDDGSAVVGAGEVGRGIDRHHAGLGPQQRQVDRQQPAMRGRRQAERGMQRAGQLGQVVDVGRGAGDMQVRRFMRQADADARAGGMPVGLGAGQCPRRRCRRRCRSGGPGGAHAALHTDTWSAGSGVSARVSSHSR